MKTVSFLAIALVASRALLATDTWQSTDGKSITADFVKLDGTTVVLSMNGKPYSVALSRLDERSQEYARFLSAGMKQWATDQLDSPIVPEHFLAEAIKASPREAEGRNFLVAGHVASIGRSSTLSKGAGSIASARLQGGTGAMVDFTSEADGRRTKLRFDANAVILLKARRLDGTWKNFTPEKTLLEVGQPAVIRAQVRNGRIEGSGLASSQEIITAQIETAKMNGGVSFEQAVALGRMRIRLEFLESQVSGGVSGKASVSGVTGYVATVTLHYTEAEKESMRQEIELIRAQLAAAGGP